MAKPVSTAPPPKGWGKIKEVFKAFAVRGVVPKWTAYRKAQVIKTYKPWMELYMLRTIRKVPLQKSWIKYVIGKDWSLPTQAWLLLLTFLPSTFHQTTFLAGLVSPVSPVVGAAAPSAPSNPGLASSF